MIQLTDEQLRDLGQPNSTPARIVNPRTNETYILLPLGEYERLKLRQYDDNNWSRNELEAIAWHTAEQEDWDKYGICLGLAKN